MCVDLLLTDRVVAFVLLSNIEQLRRCSWQRRLKTTIEITEFQSVTAFIRLHVQPEHRYPIAI